MELILLVDDDEDVRETSADMLEELGYTVIQASNGFQALSILSERPELDVLVTDIRMPGMSGLELAEQARARRGQTLKIILMSGYFVQPPVKRRFLQKPFRTQDLDQAIQAEMQTPAGC